MLVFVINKEDKPLMPCKPSKARKLLKEGKAKVISKIPFTIKLLFGSSGYTQPTVAGMDTGSKVIGCSVIANGKVLYQSEVYIREDVSKKMQQRQMYRRTRRSRKTRYRPARFDNRSNSRKEGRLAPSIRSKFESHVRERNFVKSILPVSEWRVELASFDIHKITNPDVSGIGYQNGNQKDFYNVKAYVLARDDYTCQHCKGKTKDPKLHCHHVIFRSQRDTDSPENLICLCNTCHEALHTGKIKLSGRKSKTKHATEIGIIKSQIKKSGWNFVETFGYETKYKREQILELPKTHYFDAVSICSDIKVGLEDVFYLKKHVSKGDYQQRTGKRSEKKIPTGKLFGLRKFDLIETEHGVGIVKGKRSSGYFAITDVMGNKIHDSAKVKQNCKRLRARTTTLIEQKVVSLELTHSSPTCRASPSEEGVSCMRMNN
ncbi:MAG: HNH endonuclease [Alphaproteobacteria bacterium]|nr:MAG: HNH endonuclease [Alphaproteobacteria bacterium]